MNKQDMLRIKAKKRGLWSLYVFDEENTLCECVRDVVNPYIRLNDDYKPNCRTLDYETLRGSGRHFKTVWEVVEFNSLQHKIVVVDIGIYNELGD